MSDIFEFNGAEGAGWAQPEPMSTDAIETVPEALRRASRPAWPRASEPELVRHLSPIHNSDPTRPLYISYAAFCLKKKKTQTHTPPAISNVSSSPSLALTHTT